MAFPCREGDFRFNDTYPYFIFNSFTEEYGWGISLSRVQVPKNRKRPKILMR